MFLQNNLPLVSVIIPAYNVENYIADTIKSVLSQTYTNWELIIVNDGSTDNTEIVVSQFQDERIKYLYQENKGVGAARNLGLNIIKGDFFCFLDGDDIFPPQSIEVRVKILNDHPFLDYVDGAVVFKNENLDKTLRKHIPAYKGKPYKELLRLNPACLFGNTWMIRRKENVDYKFNEQLTHAEDLYFYLTISKYGGNYYYTNEEILWYRQRTSSAMKNLRGLEVGYQLLYKLVKNELGATRDQLLYLKYKITRIMFASYLGNGKSISNAVRSVIRNLSL